MLTGRTQYMYASLSPESSLDYELVKAAVLKPYELVLKVYHQKLCWFRKGNNQMYVEYGYEKEIFSLLLLVQTYQ